MKSTAPGAPNGKPETPRRLASMTAEEIAGMIAHAFTQAFVQTFQRQMLDFMCAVDKRNFATLADDWPDDCSEWLLRFTRDD